MKKIKVSLVFIVLLAVLYLAASWYAGSRVQSVLERLVADFNAQMQRDFAENAMGRFEIEIAEYQRGVFSSKARYVLHMRGMEDAQIQFQDILQHGPLPWELLQRGEFSPLLVYSQLTLLPTELTQPWFDLADEPPLFVQSRVTLSQDATAVMRFSPFASDKDQQEVKFSGGELILQFSDHFKRHLGTGHIAAISYAQDGIADVQMQDMHLTVQSQKEGDTQTSEGVASIANLSVTSPTSGTIALGNLSLTAKNQQVGSLVDSHVRYQADTVRAQEHDLGAFELGVGFKRIDILAFSTLVQVLERMALSEDEEVSSEQIAAIQTQIDALLQAQPVIAIDPLRWTTEKGESRLVVTTTLAAAQDNDKTIYDEDFFLQYLNQVDLALEVSREMAVHIATLLQDNGEGGSFAYSPLLFMLFDRYASELEKAGLVRIEGDKVSLNASYRGEDESVDLNGKRMSLAEFVIMVMRAL